MELVDTDGDGVDDRFQKGPGEARGLPRPPDQKAESKFGQFLDEDGYDKGVVGTMELVDTDGDGVDDRFQKGPGEARGLPRPPDQKAESKFGQFLDEDGYDKGVVGTMELVDTDGDGVDDRFQKGPGEARGLPRPPDQKAESKFGQFLDEDGYDKGVVGTMELVDTDGDGVDDRFQKGPGEARGLPRPPDQKAESKFGQFLDEDGYDKGVVGTMELVDTDGDGVDDRFQKGPGEARGLPRPPDQKAESKFGQFLDEDGYDKGVVGTMELVDTDGDGVDDRFQKGPGEARGLPRPPDQKADSKFGQFLDEDGYDKGVVGTMELVDTDADGVDDRFQKGPGQPRGGPRPDQKAESKFGQFLDEDGYDKGVIGTMEVVDTDADGVDDRFQKGPGQPRGGPRPDQKAESKFGQFLDEDGYDKGVIGTMEVVDTDADGVDDRFQKGPGQPRGTKRPQWSIDNVDTKPVLAARASPHGFGMMNLKNTYSGREIAIIRKKSMRSWRSFIMTKRQIRMILISQALMQ